MKRAHFLLLAALSVVSLAVYLAASVSLSGPGFPLDDAWIHQTYARNLATHFEWAFIPGSPSAGATSLLWVLLLAPGYWLGLAPYAWTFVLGALLLLLTALVGWRAAQRLIPGDDRASLWIAAALTLEWHLVWAAGSGMETLLFAWLATLVLARILTLLNEAPPAFWWQSGLLAGLACLARPDGLTLLGPLALAALIYQPTWRARFRALLQSLLGFALFFIPYLLFNYALSGHAWPNTFYAKQAEYAELMRQPFLQRLADLIGLPLVGVGVLLLPGFLWVFYRALRERRWNILLVAAWILGFIAIYALRLPVTFQHARYLIPVIPIYLILGGAGTFHWLRSAPGKGGARILSRAWLLAAAVVLLVFWGLGARAYRQDVAFINSEMVATARWVASNTPTDALIAAHDIGALGYFSERPLVDLAGLVSPEVIPFIRDESRLAAHLDEQKADFLVTFPGWYPELSSDAELVFQTSGLVSPELGGENMAVYRWPPDNSP
jgi:hypothetical protein